MIGIFDSGYGGLTIAQALFTALPQYSYLYVGDNARAPYGQRNQKEIIHLTTQGVEYLFNEGCGLVILGCNTASANALRHIQQNIIPGRYPDKRVLGIVVPTIEQITGVSWHHTEPIQQALESERATVGILATEQTVKSGAYEIEITKRNPNIFVIQQACNGLVDAIETGEQRKTEQLVAEAIEQLYSKLPPYHPRIRGVLLGCTHFELIKDVIKAHLPEATALYGQPGIVADSLAAYLMRHPEIAERLDTSARRRFVTTGDTAQAQAYTELYTGQNIHFDRVEM
ncbi:MAG: glutamate racemase [Candidatus Andersenbacteria bacterium]